MTTVFETIVPAHDGEPIYVHLDTDGLICIECGLDYDPVFIKPEQAQALADAILAAAKASPYR